MLGKEGEIKKSRLLIYCSIPVLVASVVLFALYFALASDTRVLSVDDVRGLPSAEGDYRSINNWKTVETTSFKGSAMTDVLESVGVTSPAATVKVIAPDGYFWPAVGTRLTVRELGEENADGLGRLLAYEMNGETLDPEPDGMGPLRYVAPQYTPDETNKPSWVSNLRVIEVGPLEKDFESPDPKKVPADEVWIVGEVPRSYPYGIALPIAVGGAGLALLMVGLVMMFSSKRRSGSSGAAIAVLLAACLIAGLAFPAGGARGQASATFSLAELTSMPAFSGHYTFLKQLEPYTYYEEDYTGVTLSYLINEKLRPAPGANGVIVRARDGYAATLTMEQVNRTYPGNLKAIIAYAKKGSALKGDEGPIRLIVPQNNPGKRDEGGDANTPLCARLIYAVEVTPLPGGVSVPSPGSVPEGSLAVYGAVTAAPAPAPSPAPAPQPQGQPQSPAVTPQNLVQATPQAGETPASASNAAVDMLNRAFWGRSGVLSWLGGSTFGYVLPGRAGTLFWFLYHRMGAV